MALVCDVYCDFVTFPFGILGQVVSIDHSSYSCPIRFTGRTVIIGCTSVFVFSVVCNPFFISQGILDCTSLYRFLVLAVFLTFSGPKSKNSDLKKEWVESYTQS